VVAGADGSELRLRQLVELALESWKRRSWVDVPPLPLARRKVVIDGVSHQRVHEAEPRHTLPPISTAPYDGPQTASDIGNFGGGDCADVTTSTEPVTVTGEPSTPAAS
jgi:hypothetical protein